MMVTQASLPPIAASFCRPNRNVAPSGTDVRFQVMRVSSPSEYSSTDNEKGRVNSSYQFSDHAARVSLFLFRHTHEGSTGMWPTSYYSEL